MPILRQPQSGPMQIDKANPLTRALSDVWVGSSSRRTLVKGAATVLSGTGAVVTGTLGSAIWTPATAGQGASSNGVSIGTPDALLGDTATIAVFRRALDTTARISALFGYDDSATSRVMSHAPYTDGNIYFDYGNSTAASGRVSAAYVKDTLPEVLIYTASPATGREIWRRGVRIAVDASATATRPTGSVNLFYLNDTGAPAARNDGADNSETYLVLIANRVWSPAEIGAFSANPWQIFKAPSRTLFFSAAVQLLRPASDLSAGTWTPNSGINLYATLNEVVANDATFDVTSQASTFNVGFTAGVNPGVTSGHIVRYRIVGSQTVSLMQGATVIASWSQAPTAMTTYVQTLTALQAAAITNYAALSLQFQAT